MITGEGKTTRRHSWQGTGENPGHNLDSADPQAWIERCPHCETERVRERGSKTLYLYRGGKATVGHNKAMPQDGRWGAYTVVPVCVERTR